MPSIFDAPAETPNKSRALTFTVVTIVFLAAIALWFTFRFYPEQRAAKHFFDALVAGDTSGAYQIWKPKPSYKIEDFVADWGPSGYYGPVKSYKILRSSAPRGSNVVAVRVAISPFSPLPDSSDAEKSRNTRIVSVWILPADKSFSFPP
ncbi:MAG: hypothetical protein NVS9B4_16300 [Candidatus Acidiferrum sp.]